MNAYESREKKEGWGCFAKPIDRCKSMIAERMIVIPPAFNRDDLFGRLLRWQWKEKREGNRIPLHAKRFNIQKGRKEGGKLKLEMEAIPLERDSGLYFAQEPDQKRKAKKKRKKRNIGS